MAHRHQLKAGSKRNKGKGLLSLGAGISAPSEKVNLNWSPQLREDIRPPVPRIWNFDQFINSTSPAIDARYFYKRNSTGWSKPDMCSYFVLGDLWKSFHEWSAYGVGVPLELKGNNVVQYYVPYLSGLQLYTKPTTLKSTRMSGMPPSDSNTQGKPRLVYQFIEHRSPYSRDPLADKVSILAKDFPELQTLESCDLHSSSWISVAWYPIYRIPIGTTFQSIEACFLSFYSLATVSKVMTNPALVDGTVSFKEVTSKKNDLPTKMTMPLVGMANYRFQISIWNIPDHFRHENDPTFLMEEAAELVRKSNVDHLDFNFFYAKYESMLRNIEPQPLMRL